MSIVETLLDETGKLMQISAEERNTLLCALQNCKHSGVVGVTSLRVFSERGFPFVRILSTVKHINVSDALKMFEDKGVTYEDFVCMIGIFAQDIKLRSQHGK